MMGIAKIAEQFGVSPALLQEYADYIIRKAKENPKAFREAPEAFVDAAVRNYNRQAMEFYRESLEDPEKFNQLCEDVWNHLP